MGVSEREEVGPWGGGLMRGGRGGGLEERGRREGEGGEGDGDGGREELAARGLGGVRSEPFILLIGQLL